MATVNSDTIDSFKGRHTILTCLNVAGITFTLVKRKLATNLS